MVVIIITTWFFPHFHRINDSASCTSSWEEGGGPIITRKKEEEMIKRKKLLIMKWRCTSWYTNFSMILLHSIYCYFFTNCPNNEHIALMHWFEFQWLCVRRTKTQNICFNNELHFYFFVISWFCSCGWIFLTQRVETRGKRIFNWA